MPKRSLIPPVPSRQAFVGTMCRTMRSSATCTLPRRTPTFETQTRRLMRSRDSTVPRRPSETSMQSATFKKTPRLSGWLSAVRGLAFRAAGRFEPAASAFSSAIGSFRSCGYVWREALTLIELSANPAADHQNETPLDTATAMVREHFPKSFMSRMLAPWAMTGIDPVVSRLSASERSILWHLLDGRTQKEIATITARSYQTVRTQMKSIHGKLGTHTEHQIVVTCAQRGIARPAWSLTRHRSVVA